MRIILIVENHSKLRKIIKELLAKNIVNLEIIEAATGKHGIKKTIQQKPDVIVLDTILPDMNGLAVAKQIKEKVPGSKIILLTMCAKHELCQCDSIGITTAIKKTEIFEKLVPAVQQYLKKGKKR